MGGRCYVGACVCVSVCVWVAAVREELRGAGRGGADLGRDDHGVLRERPMVNERGAKGRERGGGRTWVEMTTVCTREREAKGRGGTDLGGDDHCVHPLGDGAAVHHLVLARHLGLAVGAHPRAHAVLADLTGGVGEVRERPRGEDTSRYSGPSECRWQRADRGRWDMDDAYTVR